MPKYIRRFRSVQDATSDLNLVSPNLTAVDISNETKLLMKSIGIDIPLLIKYVSGDLVIERKSIEPIDPLLKLIANEMYEYNDSHGQIKAGEELQENRCIISECGSAIDFTIQTNSTGEITLFEQYENDEPIDISDEALSENNMYIASKGDGYYYTYKVIIAATSEYNSKQFVFKAYHHD